MVALVAVLTASAHAQPNAQDVPPSMTPETGTTPRIQPPSEVHVPLPLPPLTEDGKRKKAQTDKEKADKEKAEAAKDKPAEPPPPVALPQPDDRVETLPPPVAAEQPILPPASPDTPIVPDADFAAALPSLAEDSPPPDMAEAGDALTPPPAEAEDAELAQALAPLDGYDVQPLQATTQPEAAPEIAYDTRINGLKAVDEEDRFEDLSALEAGKGKAANAAMVRARANEDQGLAVRLMRSAGYYDGTVSATLTAPSETGDPLLATLTAIPGEPYRFGDITIDAGPTVPADLIRNALPLKTGDIIAANQVLAAEANVGLVLPQNGYPFAKVGNRDIELDGQSHTGNYTLPVETGNRARFGTFTTEGTKAFEADHIAVLTRFDQGDIYDSRKVDDLRQALVSTGLFSTVAVEAKPTGVIDAEGVETVDLLVHQNAGPARTLAAEAGFSTGQGVTVRGSWTHRNLFPPEGALIAAGVVGTQEQGVGLTFRRSNWRQRDRTLQLTAQASYNVYDSYTAYTAGFTGSVARVSTPIWQKLWTWSYGVDLLASREKAGVTSTPVNAFATYYLLNVPLKLGYDRSDDLLNPSRGYRLVLAGGPQFSLSGAGGSTLRSVVDATYYHPFGAKTVVASRARLGLLSGADLADIAPSRRLYAGGGGSVRGYAYQGLGPLDSAGDPTGGRSLFEASVEVRYRWGDWGVVPFIDIGQVYDAEFPDFSDLRIGFGVGARLYSNFGPIRLDVALPVDRRADEPQFALYVGIGQAF